MLASVYLNKSSPWNSLAGSDNHVGNSEFFLLLRRAVVDIDFDLRVVLRRTRVVDEAVRERIVHNEGEWYFSRSQSLQLFNEFLELYIVC